MNALISGRRRASVIIDGDSYLLIRPDEDVQQTEISERDMLVLFHDVDDVEYIEDITPEAASVALDRATAEVDALHVILLL